MGRHGAGGTGGTNEVEYVPSASFEWEPVPAEPPPHDPRRRRRVRGLVVACVIGALAIVAIAVVATIVLAHEAHKRTDENYCYVIIDGKRACPEPGSPRD